MNAYKPQFKAFLAEQIKIKRKELKVSQDKMSEYLHITPRAYSDLERKKYCISTVSLLYFLEMLSDEELIRFMEDFRKLHRELDEEERK